MHRFEWCHPNPTRLSPMKKLLEPPFDPPNTKPRPARADFDRNTRKKHHFTYFYVTLRELRTFNSESHYGFRRSVLLREKES